MVSSKVDGLAQVLAGLAETRQVIVFTHNNRLPEAVRRLRIGATIWAATRRDESVIEIRKNSDPIERYLSEAASILKAEELAETARSPWWPAAAAQRWKQPATSASDASASVAGNGMAVWRSSSRRR
ncbi:hypothetical protein GCM10010169_16430 [Micromonospora fulviviridis]|nr:hypothetical protein GCM10010169_16430 [Micromonospora fulviviridis]